MAHFEIYNPDWEEPVRVINHRRQPKSERETVNIYFSNYTTSMTVHCFDEDGEMSIVVRDGKQKAIYTMPMDEVKQLKTWLINNIKDENHSNQIP